MVKRKIREINIYLNIEKENLHSILENVYNSFKNKANEKDIIIIRDYPEKIPFIDLDRRRFRQVLNNLLSNSLQYSTEKSKITIKTEMINTNEKEVLIISVRDTGIGMTEEHLEHIFDRFYRVDTSRSRLSGGTGLGLSISRTIVEAHGGRIKAESIPGEGTCFSIFLNINT